MPRFLDLEGWATARSPGYSVHRVNTENRVPKHRASTGPLGYSVPIGGHKRRQRIPGTARPSQVQSDGRLVMSGGQLYRAGLLGRVVSLRWPREGGPLKCRADNIKRLNVRSPVQEFSENLQHFWITA
jgi:hypothetical protein